MPHLKQAIEDFLAHCQYERGLSAKTWKAYDIDLRQFREFVAAAFNVHGPEHLDRANLREYLRELNERHKAKTVKRKVAVLKSFLNHLEFEDRIVVNPLRKMRIAIREQKALPRTIGLSDLRRLFRHVYALKQTRPGLSRTAVRDIAVLELLFATGMRVSELTGLHASSVDLRQGIVRILGKGNRERIVPICSEETRSALLDYAADRAGADADQSFFVNRYGRRLSEQSVRFMIRKHARKAGIGSLVTPHMFRHTVATLLLGNGMDIRHIQHLLGHSSIATTQIYAHVDARSHRRILKQKHPRRMVGTYEPSGNVSYPSLDEDVACPDLAATNAG